MRKNVKQQLALRVLSTAALMAMVSSIATAAFADTYDLNTGSVTVETKDDGYTYVTQEDTKTGGYAQNSNGDTLDGYKDTDPKGVTITSNGEQTSNTITVETADKQTTNVTLQDVNIDARGTDKAAISTEGDVTIELDGNNKLVSGTGHAGLETSTDNSQLTIKDDNKNAGSLDATGGDSGAGIGGGKNGSGNVTITGGSITAEGGWQAAGIGGGSGGNANVSINDGANVVKSTGGNNGGAGIGSGTGSTGETTITIEGGKVTEAIGGLGGGAGIGGGWNQKCDDSTHTTVTIDGGKVDSTTGADLGAGIGGGRHNNSTVTIKNGSEIGNAQGGANAAGIGGGSDSNTDVTIEGSHVGSAVPKGILGQGCGSGIGAGFGSGVTSNVTIKNSTVDNAKGEGNGSGIGVVGGCVSSGKVEITGSTVNKAEGGSSGGSGIGGNEDTKIEITGSDVNATGSSYGGAGIGSSFGEKVDITISGGKITATGGVVGIGGGDNDSEIKIKDGAVIEEASGAVTGIGNYRGYGSTTVEITDSEVKKATGASTSGAGIGSQDTSTKVTIRNSNLGTVSGAIGISGGIIKILGNSTKPNEIGSVTGTGGAGIGNGLNSKSEIEISDTKIGTVTGGEKGAGIGGGTYSTDNKVTITKSTIDSVTGAGGAGIGGGYDAVVEITGSKLGTVSGSKGAGIGNGAGAGSVTIDHSEIGAAIGKGGAGIGAETVTIQNGSVIRKAQNTDTTFGHAGIGSCPNAYGGTINIFDSEIWEALGGGHAAGIGGSSGSFNVTINLARSLIKKALGGAEDGANGLMGGAGIGSAGVMSWGHGTGTTININNTDIDEATGGAGAAGIGGGFHGTADITITGGNVTATAGKMRGESFGSTAANAPFAIGNGELPDVDYFKTKGNVTINGNDGDTIVNAIASDLEHAISQLNKITVDSLGEAHKVLVNMRDTSGTILKAIHNRAYVGYPADAEEAEAHAWDGGVIIKDATPDEDGEILYTCTVEGCGATKHGVLPKLTPEEMREVGVIFWDAAAQAAPAALQGKVLSADEQTATAEKAQVESLLADKVNWKLAEDVGDLKIHPAADAAGTVYEQAVKASGCQYYVIANVTAQ